MKSKGNKRPQVFLLVILNLTLDTLDLLMMRKNQVLGVLIGKFETYYKYSGAAGKMQKKR